jgi:hypothetical protein
MINTNNLNDAVKNFVSQLEQIRKVDKYKHIIEEFEISMILFKEKFELSQPKLYEEKIVMLVQNTLFEIGKLENLKLDNLIPKTILDDIEDIQADTFPDSIISSDMDKDVLNVLLKHETHQFQEYIKNLNIRKDQALEEIKTFQIQDIKKLDPEFKKKYVLDLTRLYQDLCYYPTTEVKLFFKKAQFSDADMVFFISIETILKEIAAIIKRNKVVIFKGFALMSIDAILKMRIRNEVHFWAGFYKPDYDGRKNVNQLFIDAKNMLRREGNLLFHYEDQQSLFELLAVLFGKKVNDANVLSFIRADNAKISGFMFLDVCFKCTKGVNKIEFCSEFFDLLKPIIEKKNDTDIIGFNMLSKNEFKKAYVNRNYDSYKGKRICDIFFRNK